MREQAGYVIILNISIFCEIVDKIFVSDATSDRMTVHGFVDAEEYVTVNDEFMKAVFCDGLLRDVHDRDANPRSFG